MSESIVFFIIFLLWMGWEAGKGRGWVYMTTFQFVKATDEQIKVMQNFRDKYEALAKEVGELTSSRGLSLSLTKLEESAFWLNKAITQNS